MENKGFNQVGTVNLYEGKSSHWRVRGYGFSEGKTWLGTEVLLFHAAELLSALAVLVRNVLHDSAHCSASAPAPVPAPAQDPAPGPSPRPQTRTQPPAPAPASASVLSLCSHFFHLELPFTLSPDPSIFLLIILLATQTVGSGKSSLVYPLSKSAANSASLHGGLVILVIL